MSTGYQMLKNDVLINEVPSKISESRSHVPLQMITSQLQPLREGHVRTIIAQNSCHEFHTE